ncbi:MAG TPA: cytochrome P450 [Chloroflexota bacterium]|nr:cytochrome P450 [Chloroflexota bacterium]
MTAAPAIEPTLSLYQLLDPEVLANPYPLFRRLREEAPVHWDPYLHAWVITRYDDVLTVLREFSANRTPTPEQLEAIGLSRLKPLARMMVRQMLFLDPPDHSRVRHLAAKAFTPRRIEQLRQHIQAIADDLVDRFVTSGQTELMADFAAPLPAIVTAEMLGLPASDWRQLRVWSSDFAEVLGNFQHNPDRAEQVLRSLDEMTAYFEAATERAERGDNLITWLLESEEQGDHLSPAEIVANLIITMVGGQETTTNLIGNGMLTLLRHPEDMARLRADSSLLPSAVEELLRFEPPSQHTARLAPRDTLLGGQLIRERQAVIVVMAAGNRDPERFPDPDRLDLARPNNRHLSFGWAAHFCFGAPLARMEGQIAFETLLRRLPDLRQESAPLVWRQNLGLRGLTELRLRFGA